MATSAAVYGCKTRNKICDLRDEWGTIGVWTMYRTFQATHHGSVPFSTGCSMQSALKYFTEPVEFVAVGQTTMPASKNKAHTTSVNTLVVMYKGVAYSHPMFDFGELLYVLYTGSTLILVRAAQDAAWILKRSAST